MVTVSEVYTTPPANPKTELERKVFDTLTALSVPFWRVDTGEAITMEDCEAINLKLACKTVKTLFLCNRQQTAFYLFVTPGDKPFRSKDFSTAMEISRVSFAPPEFMAEMLGTTIGSTTVFSVLLERTRDVTLVFDKAVLSEEWYGCADGTTTGYMKLRTEDLLHKVLPFAGRELICIEV